MIPNYQDPRDPPETVREVVVGLLFAFVLPALLLTCCGQCV
jgi:hypothetical protein